MLIQGVVWCVAKPNADQKQLITFLEYACTIINCQPIQPGGSCWDPPTPIGHGSYALNEYFKGFGICSPNLGVKTNVNPCKTILYYLEF